MVKQIARHHLEIIGVCAGIICILVGYCFGQGVFHGGVPADVFEIRQLNERISERLEVANIEFEHIEQAITTATIRMLMWQDSNDELNEIKGLLERIAEAQEELAGT